MMKKAEVEAVKSVSVMWLVALTSTLFMLSGCGSTIYMSKNTINQASPTGVKQPDGMAAGVACTGQPNLVFIGTEGVSMDAENASALGMEGSIPNIGGFMDRINPVLTKPTTVDNSQVDNSQTTNIYNEDRLVAGEDLGVTVDPGKTEPLDPDPISNPGEYKNKATYTSYGERNGGRKAWRIPKKGPEFGKAIKVVFADGHTVFVKDTSHNYRESDGFVFKPGIGPNGEGEANTGTAHGGVYLHAPYGNKSNTVTFYFD